MDLGFCFLAFPLMTGLVLLVCRQESQKAKIGKLGEVVTPKGEGVLPKTPLYD